MAILNNCYINLFTYDTVLLICDNLSAVRKIRADIFTLTNRLKLTKNEIRCAKNKKLINNQIELDGLNSEIERVNVFKYLGVHIDDKLTFKRHIDDVVKSDKKIRYVSTSEKSAYILQ